MPPENKGRDVGFGRGKVFPASRAQSLVSPLRRLVQSPRRTVSAMGLARHDTVLEVGAGPGFFSSFIADAVPQGALVVLDLQEEMVQLARARLTGQRATCFVRADAMALPFRAGSFDALLIATVLGEVPDREGCLAEVRRVLAGGGVASFAETRRDSDFIRKEELTELAERHSLRLIDRSGPGWQYVARFRAV